MDWEWSDQVEAAVQLPCPLCHQSGGFTSVEQLLQALQSLAGSPSCCPVCGHHVPDLPSYLQHLACHLAPNQRTAASVQSTPERPPVPSVTPTPVSPAGMQCPHCPRMFKTARGRTSHIRAKHVLTTAPAEPAGIVSAAGTPPQTAAPLDGWLGVGRQDTVPPQTARGRDQEGAPDQSSGEQVLSPVALPPLPSGAAAPPPLAPPFPGTTALSPASGTSAALSPPTAGALGRRGDGGRRLRRLLQASHTCGDCGRVFRLRPGLAAHRRLAHGDGACEQCIVCQRRFTSVRRLQRHLAGTHGLGDTDHTLTTDDKTKTSSPHECPTCKKTFTTAHFLRKHMKLHTGETPYVCEVCGRAFALQQSYHKHQQYHTAVRPYSCPQCARTFRESATLQNHMRIHSGEKPWTCETCGKSFRQRITYVVHRRIHTGALPYTCALCQAGFRYKVSLRAHKCTAAGDSHRDGADLSASGEPLRTASGPQSPALSAGVPHSPATSAIGPQSPKALASCGVPSPVATSSGMQSTSAAGDCRLSGSLWASPEASPVQPLSPPPPPPPPPGPGGSAVPETVGAQLPYKPKVSRVLLRRLVNKLRSRQELGDGHRSRSASTAAASPPPALQGPSGSGHDQELVTIVNDIGGGGSWHLDGSPPISTGQNVLMSPQTSANQDSRAAVVLGCEPLVGLDSVVAGCFDSAVTVGPGGNVSDGPESASTAGLGNPVTEIVTGLNSTAVDVLSASVASTQSPTIPGLIDVTDLSLASARSPTVPGMDMADLSLASAHGTAMDLELDLNQLFDFPMPERVRPPLSPLHRAIESVARELANIPLHSPPPPPELANIPLQSPPPPPPPPQPAAAAASPPSSGRAHASSWLPPPSQEQEEPADLDLLLSQLFDP